MNVISGVSVTLYEPPFEPNTSGKKFKATLVDFYPWDTEPDGALNDPEEGARILYAFFRNPMAHALGFQARRVLVELLDDPGGQP